MFKKTIALFLILVSLSQALDSCEFIDSPDAMIIGPEDLTRLTDNIFVVTSHSRIEPSSDGRISLYNASTNTIDIQDLGLDFSNFYPFGIYYDETENKLYVINKRADNDPIVHTIEIFTVTVTDVNTVSLTHTTTLTQDSTTYRFNSLVYIGGGKIILSHGSHGDTLKLCKFNESSAADQNMTCTAVANTENSFNNGIDWDRDSTVIVSWYSDKKIIVYSLVSDDSSVTLTKEQTLEVECLPDNITYDSNKSGFTFAGPIDDSPFTSKTNQEKLEYIKNVDDKAITSFAGLIKKKSSGSDEYEIETINKSSYPIDGASAAVLYGDEFVVIGSWFDKSIARCPIQKQSEETNNGSLIYQFTLSLVMITAVLLF